MLRCWALGYFGEARRVSEPLSDTLLSDGRRELNRDLVIEQSGKLIVCPKGKITDYSSTPRVQLIWFLTAFPLVLVYSGFLWGPIVFLLRLLVPVREKTTISGVQHDCETDFTPVDWQWLGKTLRYAKNWAGTSLSGNPHAAAWQIIPCWIGLSTLGLPVVLAKNIKQVIQKNELNR